MRKNTVLRVLLLSAGLLVVRTAYADDPVANDQTVNVAFGTAQSFTLTATDADETLNYSITRLPSHGTVSGTAPNLTYTPNPNFWGDDFLLFQVDNGVGGIAYGRIDLNNAPPPPDAKYFIDGNQVGGTGVYGNGTVSLAGLAEGVHTFSIDATDAAGGHSFSSIHFTIDNTPPTVAWELFPGYPNHPVPTKGTIAMKVFVQDNLSNCPTDDNIASVRLIPPSGPQVNFIRTQDCGHYAILNFDTRTLPDGLSVFGANATDRAGNLSGTTTYNTIVDNTPPTNVTMVLAPTPTTINTDAVVHGIVSISASATDATSGMKNLKLYINSGGTDSLLGTFSGGSFSNFQLNTAGYGDGNASLRVEAYDQVDNMASTSQSVVIDNAGPTVAITSPASGATIVSLTEVLATASDLHNISVRKIQLKQGTGSFTDQAMTFTAPDHWSLNTPITTAGTYTIRAYAEDGVGNPGTNDVTVTVSGTNHPPTANDQPVSVDENVAKAITLTASDPDGDPLSYIIVTPPTHGVLSGTAPNLTYTPNTNTYGTDSFTFKVNDGLADSNVATVSITVRHINQKPTVTNDPVTTNEDTPVAITLTGSDPDNDPLTFRVTTDPSHGTLSGTAPNLTYTPDPLYSGSDNLVVVANDGALDSDSKTIGITVNHVNHAPVADNQSASTSENAAKALTLTATDADGDTLTYAVVANPAHGSLSGAAPNVTYTPDSNFSGADSFTFKANDGTTDSNVATVSLTVKAVNQAPTANGQSVSTNEDTPLGIALTGSDPEGATLSYEVTAQPSHGTLSGTAPNLTYAPGPDYNGSDSFSFRVNDGQLYSAVAAINITVNPVNDAPVANQQSVATDANTNLSITLTASDVDNDPLTYAVVASPAHGTLSGTAPNITYTPANGYTGPDKLTFKANDSHVDSNVAEIRISVGGGGVGSNQAPTANAQSVTTNEDTGKDITLTGSDPDGDSLTYKIVHKPTHGTLAGTPPNVHYDPEPNYNGSDSFDFRVNDGLVDSNLAKVTITVNPVNDAPVADTQNLKTNYQTPLAITLSGSDVDGDILSFATVGAPAHGTLSGTPPNVTYTPANGFSGDDTFTFKANDGTVDSALASINIHVNPNGSNGDNAPTADAQSPSTNEDTALAVTLSGSDPDGDPLTYVVVREPQHGTLSGTGANRTYTPYDHYHGADSFTFKVNDGQLDSNVAAVSLTVVHVNHKPVADAQTDETALNTALGVTLTGADVDGDAISFAIVGNPAHGTLSGTVPNITYTPNSGYNGTDSFTFKTNDGALDSDIATVGILVGNALGGGNHPPTANGQSVSTPEDTAKAITLTGSDTDGDPLTYAVVGTPTHGTLSGTGANQTYTPYLHYEGADSFTFKVNDGFVDSPLATVNITVTHVNHAPVANDNSVSTLEGTPAAITLTASDVDNDPLTYAVVTGPTHGTLTGTAPNLTYTPAANFSGSDSFTFKANDGTVDSNIALVSITVVHVNHPPVVFVNPDPTVGNEDTSFPVTLQATDADGDAVNFVLLTNPTNGALSGTAPNLTYTPSLHFHGTDSFIFKGNDGQDDSAPFTAHLTVNHVNHAPVANNGSSSLAQNNPRLLTLSATDVDGDALTYAVVANPAHGTLSGTGASLTYTPAANYTGSDSFTFKANDGTVDSNVATFSLTIVAGDNPPVAQDQSVTTPENVAKAVTLVATDPDAGQTLTYSVVTNPAHGTLSGTAPNLTYTPADNYSGSDVFTFKANDGTVDSNIGTVSITVTFVNQAPTISITSPVNASYVRHQVAITAVANDDVSVAGVDISIDGGAAQPAVLSGLHTYTLNWNTDATGEASHVIQATARDGAGLTKSDSVTVLVDRTAPGVSFTPAAGASVSGTTNIQAALTDDRALSFAEILIDGTQMTSRSNLTGASAQISYSWNTLNNPDGNHTVTVHAVDAAGNETSTPHIVGVHNLGGGNPAPDFDVIAPAANAYVAGIITLHGKLTVGTNVSVGYTVDGLNFTAFTPGTVNVGDDFTGLLDTTALAEGAHIIEFVATDPTVPQPTRKDITIHVDNTPPNVSIVAPTTNGTIFMVANLQATALDPNGVQLDEVRFDINGAAVASRRPGNTNPADGAYSYLLDTSSPDANGNPVYPDSPIGVSNYSLTVTAWNKARVPSSVTVPFRIDNAHIPTNPAATFTFNPTDFVWGSSGHDVWCRVSNATIDGTSFNQQGQYALQVKVKMNSGTTWQTWTGPLRLVNNTIYFDRALPVNCCYQLTVRVLDTTGKLLQSSVEGKMAIDPSAGGTFSTADGTLTFTIPAGALTRPMYFEAQLMTTRPPWMQAADGSFSQVYPSQRSVAGPFQLAGLTSMTSDWVYNEHLSHPASLNHRVDVNALPTAEKSLLRQIQNLMTNNGGADYYWHPLGTSNNQSDVNFRSVDGTSDSLGIYRVTSFAPPGSGISDVFNYPNPFHPNDGPTSITYMLGDNSDVTLVIYDALGNLVLKQQYGAGAEGGQAGLNTIPWDGRNGHGDTVASGAYIAQLLVKDVNGGHFKSIRKIGVVR